jgi:hypothetical protein
MRAADRGWANLVRLGAGVHTCRGRVGGAAEGRDLFRGWWLCWELRRWNQDAGMQAVDRGWAGLVLLA